jgi:hypothetical protein
LPQRQIDIYFCDKMSDATSSTTTRQNDIPPMTSRSTNPHLLSTAPKSMSSNRGGSPGGVVFDETSFRRSSPESDAVTSSDGEIDQDGASFFPPNSSALTQLSSRRPSYAAEFHTRQRKYSVTGGVPLSPTTSHPATSHGDTVAWAAGVSSNNTVQPTSGATLSPFWASGSIWNSDPSRKSPPKQLNIGSQPTNGSAIPSPLLAGSEALPSPTSMTNSNVDFPIPIPLHPQFRNYRSMSFSVGQMETPEDQTRPRLSPPTVLGAPRQHGQPGLHHRPSRPSLLSEEQFAGTSSPLRSVFETEDEENEREGPLAQQSYFHSQSSAAYCRAKYEAMKIRNRSASAAAIPAMTLGPSGTILLAKDGDRIDEYESALAEDDDTEFNHLLDQQRRYSEAPRSMSLMFPSAENQRLENIRRQHWQSGGAFGMGDAGLQSRRHSFAGLEAEFAGADLGKRSVDSGEIVNSSNIRARSNNYLSLTDVSNFDNVRKESIHMNEESRFLARPQFKGAVVSPSAASSQHHLQQINPYPPNPRTASPPGSHRSMMAMSIHPQQQRSQQLLYFVTFKACRGDVFYVQEGTGLCVRIGDLVIVEADRGTDLGTVIAENITWQRAKELKEQYAKEQYNVLMMYASRRATGTSTVPAGTANGANAPFPNCNPSGGVANQGQAQGQDSQTAELKPKMVKRLAQLHEIQTLRDKEANEAKAKRVCQQKVLEHRLPMEILDAEFQM